MRTTSLFRTHPQFLLGSALLLALSLTGCGKTGPLNPRPTPCVFDSDCQQGLSCINAECVLVEDVDAGRPKGSKQFGEPCVHSGECQSSFCLDGPRGAFCSMSCTGPSVCPGGFVCKVVPDPLYPDEPGAPEVSLCALPQPLLCQPCEADADCGATGGDHCVADGLFAFCGVDCTWEACPDGYTCSTTGRGRQCTPVGKTCDCSPETVGRFRGCGNENSFGVCFGAEICTADAGWQGCTAPAAAAEDCNGFDDDCDGRIDEELMAPSCTRQNGFGTCTGVQSCQGSAGWRCDAPTPAAEACNYVDDDCDGVTDAPFVDAQGRYVQPLHCGGCGNACNVLITHSAQTTCELTPAGAPECRVKACQTGFYPSADGRQCLQIADALCRACVEDSDCPGPGSRCVEVDGDKVCGRDCSAASPFPGCPGGYVCQTTAKGQQCVPQSGTCACNAQQLGITRSCDVQTCTGYQTCAQTAMGPTWSACDVASFNPELCDGVDNDCDGAVDEGFRNPATQKYEATAHCGFCNNDCSKYWSPTLHHTTGVCDASTAFPVCRMGACSTEQVGNTTFEWRDVNGDTQDGCECRRVSGNTSVDAPDEQAPYVDENCDGIDGVVTDALFVWAGAAPGGSGTLNQPLRTIGAALQALPSSGKRYILVAEGTYDENLVVGPGVRLYGGYARDFRKRDEVLFTSTIRGQTPTALSPAAVHLKGIAPGAAATVLSAFTVRGVDQGSTAAAGQHGAASYAVLVEDASASLRVVNNDILAGRGGRGGTGASGSQGFGRQISALLDGRNGLKQTRQNGPCPTNQTRAGGTAGTNPQCAGSSGVAGGGVGCPVFNWNTSPVSGKQAAYPPGSGLNGEGGFDWSFDAQSSFCSHVTESGFPSNIQPHDGRDGASGADGASGNGGAGAGSRTRLGSVVNNRWVPSPFVATGGSLGANAEGGGGGGAGGGTAYFPAGGCQSFEFGSTGGGGGAGGCGGVGGQAGGAGGASIALFVAYSATPPQGQMPFIQGNRIERNLGGDGGNGGFGGAGGVGGVGGFGGTPNDWSGSSGGKGGSGGNGGAGGGGGGGAGGPSYGILGFRVNPAFWAAGNTFVTPSNATTGGKGGTGGSSSGPFATGTPGADGASANVQAIALCAGGCPAGSQCDANGVCSAP